MPALRLPLLPAQLYDCPGNPSAMELETHYASITSVLGRPERTLVHQRRTRGSMCSVNRYVGALCEKQPA